MSDTLFRNRSKILAGIVAAVSFPVLLRLAIEFFHPKDGALLYALAAVAPEGIVERASEFVSYPIYDVLVHGVWQDATVFYPVWLLCVAVVIAATPRRTRPPMLEQVP